MLAKKGNNKNQKKYIKQKITIIINETNSCFLKINKIYKPLARITRKKEGRLINNIINKKGAITTKDAGKIKILGYSVQLYSNKLDNLEEMYKFSETYQTES